MTGDQETLISSLQNVNSFFKDKQDMDRILMSTPSLIRYIRYFSR